MFMNLRELGKGQCAVIKNVGGKGALRQHFLDMGVIPGARVEVVKFAPMGDPVEILIHGYRLSLRLSEAEKISVYEISGSDEKTSEDPTVSGSKKDRFDVKRKRQSDGDDKRSAKDKKKNEPAHPGLGESGKYHAKGDGDPLPEEAKLTFALVGNQNCGKTTLFNRLTGSRQHVGNFPGVTVDRKDGKVKGYKNAVVTDLPGIYSMSPYSKEEIVSRNFVLEEKPNAIINIVDATNIERNLYLTMQLLEMDVPMVVALNMMDELTGNNGYIDVNLIEDLLGVPVIPISAAKNEGVDELIKHVYHVAHYREKPVKKDFCEKDDNAGTVHRCLHAIRHIIYDHAEKNGLPVRFAAEKLAEGDKLIADRLGMSDSESEAVKHIISQMEAERGMDANACIAEMRFSFIEKVCANTVVKPKESREAERSKNIDRILTGKYTAIPVFIAIMAGIFFLTFNVIGPFLQELVEMGIGALTDLADRAMTAGNVNEVVHDLIIDGIFEGVGSVISFMPIIITLFFFLSILEDSGYMARVAFVMDKLLRRIGLSGRSVVPMIIGFGCTVPAVMSTRTLPSERDRKMTILLTPFMSCTAKLPIYAFFVNAFFPGYGGFVMTLLYVLGILVAILIALILKKTLFKGEAVPFVMELPNYRLPGIKNTLQLMWDKSRDFLRKALSVILIATIVVWFLKSFSPDFHLVEDPSDSILALVSGFLVPVFAPLGLGDWRICTSLITGFIAKESVVTTMQVLFGSEAGLTAILTPLSAVSMLVFSLLYTPCIAAVGAVRRELGGKWSVLLVLWQCGVAWLVALAVRGIGLLFGAG